MNRRDMAKKAVVVGIDGVPCELLAEMAQKGLMPGVKEILDSGYSLKRMKASLPDISSVSWTSFMTGVNPGEHGIFGFTHLRPESYRLAFPNSQSIKAPAFWQTLAREGKIRRSVVLNIPNTYPALPLAGLLVSGFVAIDFTRAVYPPSYVPLLKSMNYIIDVELEKATRDLDGFYGDLLGSLSVREKSGIYLFEKEEWDLFVLCITETDRLHHFFYDHRDGPLFERFYAKVDSMITALFKAAQKKLGDDFLFMILSDHGFGELREEINLNAYLRETGFLTLDPAKEFYEKIARGTTAFAMDPGRIYIHRAGRYPLGRVLPGEERVIVEKLKKTLYALTDRGGKQVIREIYERDSIYSGPCLENAPDLVCTAFDGFDLKGNMRKQEVFSSDLFRGMHTRDNAVLVVPGSAQTGSDLTIEDPAKIIKDYFL